MKDKKTNIIWIGSSLIFYILAYIFILLQNKTEDIGYMLAGMFILLFVILIASSINYHPNNKKRIEKQNKLFLLDWGLRLTTMILFWISMLSLIDAVFYIGASIALVVNLIIIIIIYKKRRVL